eukprot:g8941.t1
MRRYEELELQSKKDEEETRTKDRARLIAAVNGGREFSGVIARSHDMLRRRRQRIVDAEEQAEESRKSHEFKARPLHIADEDWQTIQNRQTMSSMSRLPKRMAMHELQRKAAAAGATAIAEKEATQTTRSKSCASPEQIRQVLSRRQRLWDQQLLAAKRTKEPVVPQRGRQWRPNSSNKRNARRRHATLASERQARLSQR